MSNDLTQLIEACEKCQRARPAARREPMKAESASFPMEKVGLDYFHANGQNYLLCVDRFSGFVFVKHMRSTTTKATCDALEQWFNLVGYPLVVRTDGGPQFREAFREWCEGHFAELEVSSPYNPSSNGLAEAAVKNAKHLLLKMDKKEDFNEAMLEWRNTPRADGVSPAEAFFGRRPRGKLPVVRQAATGELATRRGQAMKAQHDRSALPNELPTLQVGARVRVRDPLTGVWGKHTTVVAVREHGRSYWVQSDAGGG